MKYSSDILLHFVGRGHRDDHARLVDSCVGILQQGFRFTNQTVDLGREIGSDQLRVDMKAVCFTDIPLRLSTPHVQRYGTCAIGVPKRLVKTWGGNPVMYVVDTKVSPPGAAPRTDFRGLFGHEMAFLLKTLALPEMRANILRSNPNHWAAAFDSLTDAQRESLSSSLKSVLIPFLKPMFDLGPDVDGEDDQSRRDRYYMEREWRVPLWNPLIENAQKGLGPASKDGDEFYLPIPKSDVSVIIVPNRRCRIELTERLLGAGWSQVELPSIVEFGASLDL